VVEYNPVEIGKMIYREI